MVVVAGNRLRGGLLDLLDDGRAAGLRPHVDGGVRDHKDGAALRVAALADIERRADH